MSTVCVIGLGYIGLPTAALLAAHGANVIGVDTNSDLVNHLLAGTLPLVEADLKELVRSAIRDKRIAVATVPEPADVFIITVPTPCTRNKTCDLSCVIAAVDNILPCLRPGNLVIVESTVPPFTCQGIIKPLLESSGMMVGQELHLAYCPERLLPGRIIEELVNNHRVIGGYSEKCCFAAAEIYRHFVSAGMSFTDLATAEMTKLVENTYRDVNIALANEITMVCHDLGINALEVIELANHHPRVDVLQPGPGVGGHCLAVDPYFIIEKAPERTKLISAAREINNAMPLYVVNQVKTLLGKTENPRIAVLGVSYKGNVADTRESPALKVIDLLNLAGFEVAVFDPLVRTEASAGLVQVVRGADLLLLLTDHEEFKYFDYARLSELMRTPLIMDTRNIDIRLSDPLRSVRFLNFGTTCMGKE